MTSLNLFLSIFGHYHFSALATKIAPAQQTDSHSLEWEEEESANENIPMVETNPLDFTDFCLSSK